ncbi:MAG: hypothetical protein QF662_06130, partial [Phycisphaerae bacterium]|nr:hypothetical protein [Phycisphaerae bacterium]
HLAAADNVYYEVCNVPSAGGPTLEWEHKMVDTIVATESKLGVRHLVARNPGYHRDFPRRTIENPHPGVSIFNFHFPGTPYSAALQGDLNRVVADDETGFRGTSDFPYRREGWEFILSGGGILNNLDYSFTVEQPDGTFDPPPTQIGGGGPALRRQLAILKRFIEGFDFIHMRTDNSIVKAGAVEGGVVQVLCAPGEAYAVYVCGGHRATLALEISAGEYHAEWVNTLSGRKDKAQDVTHAGGPLALASPPYEEDIALRIVRK